MATNPNSDDWTSLSAALDAMRQGRESNAEAWDRLMIPLKAGRIAAKCALRRDLEESIEVDATSDVELERTFWRDFRWPEPRDVKLGVVSGFSAHPEDGRPVEVELHDFQLSTSHLDAVLPVKRPTRTAGRPHGDFWPHLAEELTVYFYENGPPEANAPIGRIADEVLNRMAQRGMRAPTSAQPLRDVIMKIIERLRAANPQ